MKRTKRFIDLSISIITGTMFIHIDEEELRKDNINDLFVKTIHGKDKCEKVYDLCFFTFKKSGIQTIKSHEKAFNFALKLLIQ